MRDEVKKTCHNCVYTICKFGKRAKKQHQRVVNNPEKGNSK